MSRHRKASRIPDGEQIRLRLELLIRSTVDIARDQHRFAVEHRRHNPELCGPEIESGFALRKVAMQEARQLRWALTGKDTLSEKRRNARFEAALRSAAVQPPPAA